MCVIFVLVLLKTGNNTKLEPTPKIRKEIEVFASLNGKDMQCAFKNQQNVLLVYRDLHTKFILIVLDCNQHW